LSRERIPAGTMKASTTAHGGTICRAPVSFHDEPRDRAPL
jgi:hypothetical protein